MALSRMPIAGKLGKEYKVTSPFGWRTHPIEKIKKHHNGTDLWGPAKVLPIRAWHDGRVIAAGTSKLRLPNGEVGGVGWYVDIRSKINGKVYVTRYAHMVPKSLKVVTGQKIEAGTEIGLMGTSGASTGKHLHIEICEGRRNVWSATGKGFVDPMKFMPAVIAADKANAKTAKIAATAPVEAKQPRK